MKITNFIFRIFVSQIQIRDYIINIWQDDSIHAEIKNSLNLKFFNHLALEYNHLYFYNLKIIINPMRALPYIQGNHKALT